MNVVDWRRVTSVKVVYYPSDFLQSMCHTVPFSSRVVSRNYAEGLGTRNHSWTTETAHTQGASGRPGRPSNPLVGGSNPSGPAKSPARATSAIRAPAGARRALPFGAARQPGVPDAVPPGRLSRRAPATRKVRLRIGARAHAGQLTTLAATVAERDGTRSFFTNIVLDHRGVGEARSAVLLRSGPEAGTTKEVARSPECRLTWAASGTVATPAHPHIPPERDLGVWARSRPIARLLRRGPAEHLAFDRAAVEPGRAPPTPAGSGCVANGGTPGRGTHGAAPVRGRAGFTGSHRLGTGPARPPPRPPRSGPRRLGGPGPAQSSRGSGANPAAPACPS